MGEKDDAIRLAVGDLLSRAADASNHSATAVLTAFDPSKDRSDNCNKLGGSKFTAEILGECAQFLRIETTDDTGKLFSKKLSLATRIVLEIESYFPAHCTDCDTDYCNNFDTQTKANASLKSCLEFINSSLNEDDDSFELCLMGDFNFPNVDWESCVALPGASLSNRLSFDILYEFIGEHMLSQYITKSTRGENCLDLFFTNSPNLVAHIDTSDTPMSDHRLVDIYFSHNPCQPIHQKPPDFDESFRGLDFSKADYEKINSCLSAIDMVALRELCDDPEDFPDLFTMVILQICTMFCPKKRPPSKKQNTSLRVLSRKKRKIKKQLDRALINPVSINPHIQSLKRKLALIHVNIKDAINQNL